jgi:hypothetical protein
MPYRSPDLLIGPNVKVGGQSDLQSRSQFSLWTLFPAPLIISNDLELASDYALETWGNEEVGMSFDTIDRERPQSYT